jgi:hypothetical protein
MPEQHSIPQYAALFHFCSSQTFRLDAGSLTPIACEACSQNTGKAQATEMKALRDVASYGLGRNSFGRLVKDTRPCS